MYVHIHIFMLYMYIYVYMCMRIIVYIYILHIYIYIYVYVCICVYYIYISMCNNIPHHRSESRRNTFRADRHSRCRFLGIWLFQRSFSQQFCMFTVILTAMLRLYHHSRCDFRDIGHTTILTAALQLSGIPSLSLLFQAMPSFSLQPNSYIIILIAA